MNVQAIVRTRMASQSALTSLIGGSAARIFPESRAQDSPLPAVVFGINNEEALKTMTGAKAWKADLEVVAVAATAATAQQVALQVVKALDAWSGEDASTRVMHSLHSRSVTAYMAPQAGEASGVYLHTTVFSVMYEPKTA